MEKIIQQLGVENIVMEKMRLNKIFFELRTRCKNLFSKFSNCHEINIFNIVMKLKMIIQ